jgi:parallel beta-helix repeat protein
VSAEFKAALRAEIASETDALDEKGATSPATAFGTTGITAPTVITEPGFYRVMADFTAAGDGIVVQSDWVWLDLGGHTITGPGNKAGRGVVLEDVSSVLVTGGTLETFGIGVATSGAMYTGLRGINVVGGDEFADPANGIAPQIGIMLVNSAHNDVRGNTLTDVNLGIFVRGGGSYENRIRKNWVTAGTHGLLGICYNPAMGEGPTGPQHDQVSQNLLCRFGGGIQTSEGSTENSFTHNVIRYLGFAYEDFNGSNIFKMNDAVQITVADGCDD